MKLLLALLSIVAVGCTQSPSTPGDVQSPELEANADVSLSNLVALNSGVVLSGDNVIEPITLSSSSSADLRKNIKISNPTSESKTLNIAVLNNSKMVIAINRCPEVLLPKQSCTVQVMHAIRQVQNGTYTGFLQVMTPDLGVSITSIVSASTYTNPSTDGSILDDVSVSTELFDNYVAGERVTKVLTITNNSTSKSVSNLSFTCPHGYRILLSRCSDTLAARSSCKIQIHFDGQSGATAPTEDDVFSIASGPTSRPVDLTTRPVYTPIFSQYSPPIQPLAPCSASVISSRTITQCVNQNTGLPSSISRCVDPAPQVTTTAPAGNIVVAFGSNGGSRTFSCPAGSMVQTFVSGSCPNGFTYNPNTSAGICHSNQPLTLSHNGGFKTYNYVTGAITNTDDNTIDMMQGLASYTHGSSVKVVTFAAAGGSGSYTYSLSGGNTARASMNALTGELSVGWGASNTSVTVEVNDGSTTVTKAVTLKGGIATSCGDAKNRNMVNTSGTVAKGFFIIDYDGNPANGVDNRIACDQQTNGGGWTIIIDKELFPTAQETVDNMVKFGSINGASQQSPATTTPPMGTPNMNSYGITWGGGTVGDYIWYSYVLSTNGGYQTSGSTSTMGWTTARYTIRSINIGGSYNCYFRISPVFWSNNQASFEQTIETSGQGYGWIDVNRIYFGRPTPACDQRLSNAMWR